MYLDFVPHRPPRYLRHQRPRRPSRLRVVRALHHGAGLHRVPLAAFPRPLAKLGATVPPDRPPIGSSGGLGAPVGNNLDNYIHVVLLSNTY